jgi:two-component system sensor histidine kinase/response regulator
MSYLGYPMKILIMDDDDGIRMTLQDILELNGHEVSAAANGLEGVRLAADCPDLILSDVDMPGMTGFEAIQAIRKLPACQHVPYIFLTGKSDRKDQRKGMFLGADDYITKPFSTQEILDAIAARVSRLLPLRERIEQLLADRQLAASANWSHELMTPLTGVLGGLDLIEMEADSIKPGELKELLGLVREGAERQFRLSHKLIRYFDLEQKKHSSLKTETVGCSAAEAITDAANGAAQAAQRCDDLRLQWQCASGSVGLSTGRLTDACAELVENAFKFSQAGQPVTVTGSRVAAGYRIEICDEGPGLSPEERTSFVAFKQFDRNHQEQQGLGLGLAIARATAELGGGELQLLDGPSGRGLLVRLEMPLTKT